MDKKSVNDIMENLKSLVKKGNVSRIVISKDDKELVNIPVNVGIVGGVVGLAAAKWVVIAAVLATVGFGCSVQVVKEDGEITDVFGKEQADKARAISARSRPTRPAPRPPRSWRTSRRSSTSTRSSARLPTPSARSRKSSPSTRSSTPPSRTSRTSRPKSKRFFPITEKEDAQASSFFRPRRPGCAAALCFAERSLCDILFSSPPNPRKRSTDR